MGSREKGNFCDGDTAVLTHTGMTINKAGYQQHWLHNYGPRARCQLPPARHSRTAVPLAMGREGGLGEGAAMGKERTIPFHKLLA